MTHLLVRFQPRVKYGGLVTFKGTRANQAVYWTLQAWNPETQEFQAPLGSLSYSRTKTDSSSLSVNIYNAPTSIINPDVYDVIIARWND
jgi:hypothetical protein